MHYILLLFALFLTACSTTPILEDTPAPAPVESTTPVVSASSSSLPVLPVTNQDTDDNDLKVIEEESLVGNYVLKRGLFRNQEITEGYLVVEEIDVNNYGYYYVTIAGQLLPETHTGIFFKKGGEFVQKVIEDSSDAEIRQGKPKSKMSIIDNVRIKQEGQLLKIFIDSDKQEKLIWKRDIANVEKSTAMTETLSRAQHEYIKYYKEKCEKTSSFCGDDAYTKVNE